MKLNISYPANGSQKIVEVDDERKLRPFMEKRMGTEVSIPEFHIYTFNPDDSFHQCTKEKFTHIRNMKSNWTDWFILIRSLVTLSVMNSRVTFSRLPVVTTSKVRLGEPNIL